MSRLVESFAEGYACLSGWADLLDAINVFPVADGDTGANLRVSLSPLRTVGPDRTAVAGQLARSAVGNSGNIAAAFFAQLLRAETAAQLGPWAIRGRDRARRAVAAPKEGTMLSLFDRLAAGLAERPVIDGAACPDLLAALQQSVLDTTRTLPDLEAAGVVDSGALGMFVFFDGFFRTLTSCGGHSRPLSQLFPGRLAVAVGFRPPISGAHCVEALLAPATALDPAAVAALGESVVQVPVADRVKLHLHTDDPQSLRRRLTELGEVMDWSQELIRHPHQQPAASADQGPVHLLTDAAGSLPRDLARRAGITLLDSLIVADGAGRPESLCDPAAIYARMRLGRRVTTGQASQAERHRLYASTCEQYGRTLDLCVGSAYTGNVAAALAWQQQNPGQLEVVDTGAASGRLAVIALLVSRFNRQAGGAAEVVAAAGQLARRCREYVCIDTLRHLAAGGRISKGSGLLGDLLGCRPVISPLREGVRRVGLVRSREAQLALVLKRAAAEITDPARALLLLQFTDNEAWVRDAVLPRLQALLPRAEVLVVPLSLTSGVHVGPGSWALAFGEEL